MYWEARFLKLIFLITLSFPVFSQDESRRLNVKYIEDAIAIDGVMDEAVWEEADVADNFWQFFPTDSVRAKQSTEVRLLYDETTIYVGIRANSDNGKYIVSSLRRDFSGTSNDNVSLIFDTFSDRTNAFMFGVTPYGVQREVQISDGGSRSGFNPTWDMKWRAESKMYKDHYDVEIAIPFTSLKFKEGVDTWGFRAYRWDMQTNEQSTWVRVPQNQLMSSLAFMGDLVFEKPLGKSRTPFAIIPYINGLSAKDFETGETDNQFKFGGDAKIAIGNSMNLDLTANPDFSNVEVDDIFTNLTRFEVFLPEKRQFFIDNSDLFANYGSSRDAVPFFSRRIGLARDTTGNLIENRIIGGARLSGKLNQDWRLGFLNIQTDEDISNEIPSNNNMMLAVQRKVFSRSNIGFFMLNRQTLQDYEFQNENDRYNRVIGTDFNLASADNVWSGKLYVHKSFQPDDSKGNLSSQAFLTYNTRFWQLTTDFVYVDKDFTSDLGFIPRKDIFKSGNAITRTFYPKKGIINTNSLRFLSLIWWRPNLDFLKSDHELRLSWESAFKDQSSVEVEAKNNYIFLTNDFDPTRTEGGVPLPGDTGYTFNDVTFQYQSNPAQLFTLTGESTIGQFFTGNRFSISGTMGVRFQPWAIFSLAIRYDQIRLPDPHPDADYWLLTPKIDVTFSKSVFWSTLVQYSNQRKNLGINSRLQWRYAPLSDLYLVYNDNYHTTDFGPSFRSINLKLTYWLNI